ncbi:hypothetical protein BO82DRAFT_432731 [Aspergillus uvarum CBS 121591]|uniref:Uncharacterized protein n=1 Tax=Aspergillus uvarum CBS 121591 TaxID=1448315 RepID=A0A319C6W0_9EURO|nr:hypothetical protein BO82DRAFT_432731 [Aspergillus uvarum CBS 121591]PYH81085.1 hypothetical protein BO82DRAFT_432731 [Aspergillus uvarum CBS 121591]
MAFPIQDFHMQQALLERQRQMRLAQFAEKQQQTLEVRRQARQLSGLPPQPQRPVQQKFGPCVPPPVQDPALEQVLHEELRLVMLARQAEHLQQNQPQQLQSQWQPKQGPPRPRSLEELQAFQTQLLAMEPDERRRAIERRMVERKAQRQEQQQQQQYQHQKESEQPPQPQQPQQPVQQIHPLHGPYGVFQLQSQLQDFRMQQAFLEMQRQMVLARLEEQQQEQQQQQQQEEGQHGAPNVSGSPAVKEDTIGDTPSPKVPVHVFQDYQLGLTLQYRRVQLQRAYRQSRVEHLLARQESMKDSYAQLLRWGLERSSPRTEDEAEILTDLKRLLEAGLVAIQRAMQEPPTVELTDEDRQLDLQLIQLNRLRYGVRDKHIAEGLVDPDEGIKRTMNTRLSSEGFEDLRLHLDRRLA